jgi:hypothetical protein
VGDVLETCIKGMKNDVGLCHYYSKKNAAIKALVNDDDHKRINELRHLLDFRASQN